MLACSTNALPMSVWILKGFFDTISKSLEEAAYIDGCSKARTLASGIAMTYLGEYNYDWGRVMAAAVGAVKE